MSSKESIPSSWEILQKKTQTLIFQSSHLQNRLMNIKSNVGQICIFRPLHSYKKLRELSFKTDELDKEIKNIIKKLDELIKNTPDRTMGETLSSCLDTIRLSTEITRLQAQWAEITSSIQQAGAFSFAIFSLYISLISFIISLLIDFIF